MRTQEWLGSWAWAVRPIIAALERLKQENPQEFKVSLEYIARPCLKILKWKKKKKKKQKGKEVGQKAKALA